MRPLVRPFTGADVEAAGELLARRHAAHRLAVPLLAARFEDPAACAAEIAAVWATEGASGAVVTTVPGQVVGYLLGAPKASAVWGPNIWVEAAGIALDGSIEVEVARDLYAAAAAGWVAEGRRAHYVLLPSYDTGLVDAFFRLAFGLQHLHGIRVPGPVAPPGDGLLVRRAVRTDIPALAFMDTLLADHQRRSPVFSAAPLDLIEAQLADWEESFDDPAYANFVAERDGVVVGSAVASALEKSTSHAGLARPDHAGFLGFAAVLPLARGGGAGRALGNAVIAWAAQEGYASVVTDWRATNLLSSRTWPTLGFEPSFVRLHRLVGY